MFTCFSQRKNLWFKQGLGIFLAVVALVFTGCPQPTDPEEGVSIKGRWVSEADPDEVYRITDTEFISLYAGEEGYKGNIVNIISDDETAGYIIIEYTKAYYSNAVGRFYAIHYKNLTATRVEICGAYNNADTDNGGGSGKETQAAAEAVYTVANGYFGAYSTCTK
jgi:hypothetical protein